MFKIVQLVALTSFVLAPLPALAAGPLDLVSQPATNGGLQRHFLFTGATVRVPLQRSGKDRAELAFRFAGASRTGTNTPLIGDGFAVSLTPGRSARLTIAGQDSRIVGKKLGLGTGAALGIAGGVVLIGLAVAVAASPKVPDNTFSSN